MYQYIYIVTADNSLGDGVLFDPGVVVIIFLLSPHAPRAKWRTYTGVPGRVVAGRSRTPRPGVVWNRVAAAVTSRGSRWLITDDAATVIGDRKGTGASTASRITVGLFPRELRGSVCIYMTVKKKSSPPRYVFSNNSLSTAGNLFRLHVGFPNNNRNHKLSMYTVTIRDEFKH